jgi:hypothetical protein
MVQALQNPIVFVDVEGLGRVPIRPMTGAVSRELFAGFSKLRDEERAKRTHEMVRRSVVDEETGEPVLTPEEVAKLPLSLFSRLCDRIREVNGLEDKEAAGNG